MKNPRYSILPARAVFDARLSCTELRVLAALGTYSDKDGWCFPSQKELVEKLSIARSTLCAAIKKLASKDIGYLEVQPRTAKGRGKVGNEYRVRMDLPPMSDAQDIGEKPLSTQPDNGMQQTVIAPMSATIDNGADVQPAGQPMSSQPDIAYNEVTTPIERPQLVLGETPRKPKAKSGTRKRVAYSIEFEEFWRSWPADIRANSDKPTAFARWKTGRERWEAATIMGAAKHYLRGTKVKDTDPGPWKPRTCQAQVFLNGKLEAAIEAFEETISVGSEERYDANLKQWVRA